MGARVGKHLGLGEGVGGHQEHPIGNARLTLYRCKLRPLQKGGGSTTLFPDVLPPIQKMEERSPFLALGDHLFVQLLLELAIIIARLYSKR